MKRKIPAILLALVLLLSQGFPALAAQAFTDVPQAHWASVNIQYVVDKGYFIGTSGTTFSPDQTLNRAMLAQVLYRHAGEPAVGSGLPYVDVTAEAWYAKAMTWASENKIFASWVVANHQIFPMQQVQRSEFAVMLGNYANHLGKYHGDETAAVASPYSDMSIESFGSRSGNWDEITAAMLKWAVPNAILNGTSETTMNPFKEVSRAEVSAMLHRFDNNVINAGVYQPVPTATPTPTPTPELIGMQIQLFDTVLHVGDGGLASLSFTPYGYSGTDVNWKSSNENVVLVDDNGRFTAVGAGGAVITATAQNGVSAEATLQVQANSSPVEEVVRLTNIERVSRGLAPLAVDAGAMKAAQVRAEELSTLFDHKRPDGRSCFTALDEAGVEYRSAGENIALGHSSAAQVVAAWVESKGHLSNILSERFTAIGVGYTAERGWVQMFID